MSRVPLEERNTYPDVVNCYNENCSFLRKNGTDGISDAPFRCINNEMAGKIVSSKSCPFSDKRLKRHSEREKNKNLKEPSRHEIKLWIEDNDMKLTDFEECIEEVE